MKAELDGGADGKEGGSGGDPAPEAARLITAVVRISTSLLVMNCSPVPHRRNKNLSSVSFAAVPGSPSHCGSLFSDQGLKNGVRRGRSAALEEHLSPRADPEPNFGKVDQIHRWKLP